MSVTAQLNKYKPCSEHLPVLKVLKKKRDFSLIRDSVALFDFRENGLFWCSVAHRTAFKCSYSDKDLDKSNYGYIYRLLLKGFFFFWVVPGIEHRVLHMLGKKSTIELHGQSIFWTLNASFRKGFLVEKVVGIVKK